MPGCLLYCIFVSVQIFNYFSLVNPFNLYASPKYFLSASESGSLFTCNTSSIQKIMGMMFQIYTLKLHILDLSSIYELDAILTIECRVALSYFYFPL